MTLALRACRTMAAKICDGLVDRTQPSVRKLSANKSLPIVDEPFLHGPPTRRECLLLQISHARPALAFANAKRQRAVSGAIHVALTYPPVDLAPFVASPEASRRRLFCENGRPSRDTAILAQNEHPPLSIVAPFGPKEAQKPCHIEVSKRRKKVTKSTPKPPPKVVSKFNPTPPK